MLCVPEFKFNQLSVSKMTRELNCCALFFPEFCLFQDLLAGKVKEIGREEYGLYVLDSYRRCGTGGVTQSMTVREIPNIELWHQRIGNILSNVLKKINSISISCDSTLNHCNICPMAR